MTPPMAPEAQMRASLPVFVNSFEQLTYLWGTVDWFAANALCKVTVMGPDVYGTKVDMTFFQKKPLPVRIGGPGFLAGHRPWYFDNGLSAQEEMHYRQRATVASTHFGREA